jgi:hypothetical protein
MIRRVFVGIFALLFTGSVAVAQAVPATGSVSGHVICNDTQRPARSARVVLQPVVDTKPLPAPKASGDYVREGLFTLTPTGLDGSFAIDKVPPGRYYVIAEQEGYISAVSQFTRDQLNHPDDATQARIQQLLTAVTVTAGHNAEAEVRLVRGGAISGTVHFDDGSPAVHVGIALLQKDKTGKWVEAHSGNLADPFSGNRTDDRGQYRLTGLAGGDYLVRATLAHSQVQVDHVFGPGGSVSFQDGYSLSFFAGDVMRARDATPVHVDEGAETEGSDIDIPTSKLHSVSGTLQRAGTAHTINAGHLALLYADDNTELTSTDVAPEDSEFHFLFVPEGSFILKASAVRDVSRTEISNGPNMMPPTHTEEKTLHAYPDASAPLIVQSDLTGVMVNVQPGSGAQ